MSFMKYFKLNVTLVLMTFSLWNYDLVMNTLTTLFFLTVEF